MVFILIKIYCIKIRYNSLHLICNMYHINNILISSDHYETSYNNHKKIMNSNKSYFLL